MTVMTVGSASAPGKVVLCGEYAVLEGAPAISMAVQRRARVQVAASAYDFHTVSSPGLHDKTLAFRDNDEGAIHWLDGTPAKADSALLEQVWHCVQPPPAYLALTLDTREFFDEASGTKLGFGGSSALAVALTAALMRRGGRKNDVYRAAALAHRNFQAGRGSGVDVATANCGGVIGFSMRCERPTRLQWPDGLHFGLLWCGKSARTIGKLAKLERFTRGGGAARSAARLADAAAEVYETWQQGNSAATVEALRSYTVTLQQFSIDHDLGVFDAGHQELFEESLDRDLIYKPCGAGGGDIGIVFALQSAAIADFAERARPRGFERLDILPDALGVTYEEKR